MTLLPLPALGALEGPGAAAAAAVWAELDGLAGKPLSQRGRGAMDVAAFVDGLPVEHQTHPRMQSGIRLAMSWLGEAMLEVRDTMAAIARGAEVDDAVLDEALRTNTGHSRRERRALAAASRRMAPESRQAYARRVARDIDRLQREAQASIENGFEGSSLIRIDPVLSARAQRAHLGAGVDIEDENLVLMLVGLVAASMAGLLGVTFAISGSVQLLVGILSVDASLMLGSLPSLIIGALLIWLAVWAIRRIVRTMRGKRSHTALRLTTPELVRQR
ncbi:MAG: hypothetical protein P8R54_25030 [Myxococcota bacterium]|nr:hypothetical protein [Myxococcota bacterium]